MPSINTKVLAFYLNRFARIDSDPPDELQGEAVELFRQVIHESDRLLRLYPV